MSRLPGAAGLVCLVCHRPGAKRVRIAVECDGKRVADEPASLCETCWGDRFALRAAVERSTRAE